MKKILILTAILLLLVGCGRDNIKNGGRSGQVPNNDYSNTYAYHPNSPYAAALKECALIEDTEDSCTLATLPLLGQESYTITKEMILNRLLVSHQWMGDRFAQMLDRYSDKMIQQLFRATTAIVIDDDIIPAYYWAVTGAIYLDPHFLWSNQAEKQSITNKDDYRTGYGTVLRFVEGTFYREGGASLYTQDQETRSLHDIELSLAGLLYHELTHANDFIPPTRLSTLDNSKSVLDNVLEIGNSRVTSKLYAYSPLHSETLASLGQVLFQGATATSAQKQISGTEAGMMFDDDVSDAMYAYSTEFEDTAMLMQSSMMKYFYNVDSYQVFINADDYAKGISTLEWGIKNPQLKALVLDRAIFVANNILPIEGGWNTPLLSIADGASLLATAPKGNTPYMNSNLHINTNELKFNKNHITIDF